MVLSYIYSFTVITHPNDIHQSSLDIIGAEKLTAPEIFKYLLQSAKKDVESRTNLKVEDNQIYFNFVTLVKQSVYGPERV